MIPSQLLPKTCLKLTKEWLLAKLNAPSSPSQPVSETPVDAEECKTLENALKKLFETEIDPEELLVEYIRRDSNPQPSVPKTDALSS